MIYFDHNATTPLDEQVVEAMLPYLTTFYGNPSSLYKLGRIVRSAVDTAREQVAALVDAQPAQIIFTSGGTEANNLALSLMPKKSIMACSAIEHPSITEYAQQRWARCSSISVNRQGIITQSALEALSQQPNIPELISVMIANNETGAIQDIAGIVPFLIKEKTLLHTDAIQAIGKIPVSFSRLGVDLMSLSSHKIYGPKGCGALVVGKKVAANPLLIGGGQEQGWRAGTENVAAIVGFGKAAELALSELEQHAQHCLALRLQLERGLKDLDNVTVFSEQVTRLPNTVQFSIAGMDGEMLLMQLDQNNIAVSSGSACASAGGKASEVLTAMGVTEQVAKGALRISFGKNNTEEQVKQFITVLKS
ncbi:MAG: aminotransferase class V-fold PLP-dependent enzyme, partial [Methylococcaceae bacterium]|nr:aminotransferase class V-fold PLP-dependent enzyme [Methylococcaceae bacterium]